MKTLLYICIMLIALSSCTSSKKYYERGNYDMATQKAVQRLMNKPDRDKEITILKQAYHKAQQNNMERIMFLRKTGQPDIWEEVFQNYEQLKIRQALVDRLPASVKHLIDYKPVNYDTEIIEAQKKACEYFYAHAKQLLGKNDKLAARQAFEELRKIKNYYSDYKDVEDLLEMAKNSGTTFVLFKILNTSDHSLPQGFENEFSNFTLSELDSKWVSYHTNALINQNYDYTIVLNLKSIAVSPERIREKTWQEFKEIQDGWKYQLDKNGNVMKDSSGNDIKIPKYIKISCFVLETQQYKEAVLSGRVEFFNNNNSQLMTSEPITANSVFSNYFILANGDLQALSTETQKRLGNGPLPFPDNYDMIMMAGEHLQKATKNIINYKGKFIK